MLTPYKKITKLDENSTSMSNLSEDIKKEISKLEEISLIPDALVDGMVQKITNAVINALKGRSMEFKIK